MFDLITIGDATFDTFVIIDDNCKQCRVDVKRNQLCINYADKVCVKHIDQSVGGNAANVAAGVQKLGLQTAIVTELGDDINGFAIAHDLEKAGVNCDNMVMHKKKETRFSIVLNYRAERTILSYHADRKYTFKALPKTDWVYYTSMGSSFAGYQKKLMSYLKKHPSIKLAANPGSFQMNAGLKTFKAILPHVSLLFVNKEELKILAGGKKTFKAQIKSLQALGIETIVVTDSMRGAYAASATTRLHMPAYPIAATAKTGAGDAFASGFLSQYIKGKELSYCMQAGTANASGVIEKIGAHKGLLTARTLTKRIKTYANIKPTKF